MRLLFVSRAYFPAVKYGGPVTSLRRMCTMLADGGHDVTVVCSDLASPGMGGDRLPAGDQAIDGVRVRILRTWARYHWEGIPAGARRVIDREVAAADMLHVTGTRHFLGAVAEASARWLRTPYLVMPEGSIPARSRNIGLKRVVDALYTRRSLRRSERVVATSDSEAADLLAWGVARERLLVLPPRADAIDPSPRPAAELRAERGLPARDPVLLWMGRIHPEKGLPALFDAMGDPRLARAHLVMAGDAEDQDLARKLRSRAEGAGLRGRVHFAGWVDHEAKAELFKLADLFVFPSRRENFGLAAAEAVASGLPIVVSDGCGIASLVRGRAGLVCTSNAVSIADAVDRALSEPGLLETLRDGTDEVAKQLDWPPLVAYLEGVYREVVDETGRRTSGQGRDGMTAASGPARAGTSEGGPA